MLLFFHVAPILIFTGAETIFIGKDINYSYQQKSNVRLIPEIDGTRIISHKTYSFLQAIPGSKYLIRMFRKSLYG